MPLYFMSTMVEIKKLDNVHLSAYNIITVYFKETMDYISVRMADNRRKLTEVI